MDKPSDKLTHPQRAVKPAKNHPWKKSRLVSREIAEFARENSVNPHVNNFKKGGGFDPWNK